jgi:hypothetical protein
VIGRLKPWLELRRMPLQVALLAGVLALPSLWTGLACDDHQFRMVQQGFPGLPEFSQHSLDIFTFANGDPERNAALMERGYLPWFAAPELRFAFWRPLAAITHWIDDRIWGDQAIPAHLQNVLWYGALILVIAATYRRFSTPVWVAGLATMLYALDGLHFIPIGWIASRNAMMSCIAALLALAAHDRWRRERRPALGVVGPIWLAIGLLCGESAIGLGGYLLAYVLCIERGPLMRRLAGIVPYGVVVFAWQGLYRYFGYGVDGSGLYLDPATATGEFLLVFPRHLVVLLQGLLFGPNPLLWVTMTPPYPAIYLGVGVIAVAATTWILWPLLRRDALARFWALGMLASLVPGCAVVPQDRVLFLPGLGCMALVARFLKARDEKAAPFLGRGSRYVAARALAVTWVVVHLVLSPVFAAPVSYAMALYDYHMTTVAHSFPRQGPIDGEEVIILRTPSDLIPHSVTYIRASLRWPSPLRQRALYAGRQPLEIYRADEATLVLRPADSFAAWPWAQMFRSPGSHPFERGDTVYLSGLTVEVLQVEDSKPTEVEFAFDTPLEDAADHWLTWSGGELVPFELPRIGETIQLPEIRLLPVTLQIIRNYFETGAWKRAHRADTGPLARQ